MAGETVRKTTTIPVEHADFYDEEVKRQRMLGIKTTMADLIRDAIADDIKRRKRRRHG